jgi:hypothetical protein
VKFELIPTNSEYHSQDFILYITRNELIKLYEENKALCYSSIGTVSEMFTAPNCFECYLEPKYIDSLYNGLIEHKSYKGVLLSIVEIARDEYGCARRSLKLSYRVK